MSINALIVHIFRMEMGWVNVSFLTIVVIVQGEQKNAAKIYATLLPTGSAIIAMTIHYFY